YTFNNPQRISSILVCLSSLIILYQCTVAYSMVEWYKLIGLVINGLFCFVNFYLHLRNSILVQFVYSKKVECTSPTSSSLPTSTTATTTTPSATAVVNQTVNHGTANAFNVSSVNSPSYSSSSSPPHGNSPNHTTHLSRNSISM
ncbi:unnamed protein product, partial [Trichobilharzia szidati]